MRNQAATADRHVAGHEDPSRIRWGSAAAAGIIGGLVFMMLAMIIHFILCIVYGLIVAVIVRRMGMAGATFEVPAQVVPGPATQSFLPLRVTPKHFSLSAVCAAAGSAAKAVPNARARAAAGRRVAWFMRFSPDENGQEWAGSRTGR